MTFQQLLLNLLVHIYDHLGANGGTMTSKSQFVISQPIIGCVKNYEIEDGSGKTIVQWEG